MLCLQEATWHFVDDRNVQAIFSSLQSSRNWGLIAAIKPQFRHVRLVGMHRLRGRKLRSAILLPSPSSLHGTLGVSCAAVTLGGGQVPKCIRNTFSTNGRSLAHERMFHCTVRALDG